MKRILMSIILLALLSGCGTDKEFNNLVSQAETHYANKDIASAREVYVKALELKEDVDTRTAYKKVTADIEMAKDATAFRDRLRELRTKIGTTFDKLGLSDEISATFDLTTEMKSYKTDTRYYSGFYLSRVQNSKELDNLRTESALYPTRLLTGSVEAHIAQKAIADAIKALLDFDDYLYDDIK